MLFAGLSRIFVRYNSLCWGSLAVFFYLFDKGIGFNNWQVEASTVLACFLWIPLFFVPVELENCGKTSSISTQLPNCSHTFFEILCS